MEGLPEQPGKGEEPQVVAVRAEAQKAEHVQSLLSAVSVFRLHCLKQLLIGYLNKTKLSLC